MRKISKYLVISIMGFVVGYLIVQVANKYNEQKETEVSIQTLPKVDFTSVSGDSINLQSYASGQSLVLIYFHPECEHCQYEAQEIGQNVIAFNNCQVLMITSDDSIPRVEDFCNKYHLWELENFEVLLDKQNRFKKVFGKAVVPSVYIYDKERKLKKQFLGETKLEAIIAEIGSESDTLFLENK